VKCCVIIPCYNHPGTVAKVVHAALKHLPVLVVDDGSTLPLPELPVEVVKLPVNRGKGAALRAGFNRALELGFTHAITMDADDQHSADDLPKFMVALEQQPGALIVGVRDFEAAGAPRHRIRSNAVSSFWFRVETGVRLPDTQCGFRCYPLALVRELKIRTGRYAFELEFMVRAAWLGTPIVPVPIQCTYRPEQIRQSHFRPVRDLAHITGMNIGLVIQSWTVPRPVRMAWSRGERYPLRRVAREFFAENSGDPLRLALAVGLGFFCGIAPIWGFQLITAATLAHLMRLNKAITLLASNISIPPMMPLVLWGGLALGHYLFTGRALDFSVEQMTKERALAYVWQWVVGSFVLAILMGILGTVVTYVVARAWQRKARS
jgi:uncharacterized protein (DUF2062 family)